MKVMTILGTRPEIIRLSLIINKLDILASTHVLVHTGQNFTESLSDLFFRELKIREPDYILSKKQATLGGQLGNMFSQLENILLKEKPDKILVLGDTNSGLSSILAERMGIPVFHMEAGNRCFDLEVPEEKNRKVIDAISSFNLPYTPQSKENLMKEGYPKNRIILSGNPINEVLNAYKTSIGQSQIIKMLGLKEEEYFLATIHRAENVDNLHHLREIMDGINRVAEFYRKRIICSIHPRTQSKLQMLESFTLNTFVEFHEPFGFFDFVKLEQKALCVLTDSGTVQEECCIFRVPSVTVRRTTERPETIDCGSNVLSGINAENILNCVKVMLNGERDWSLPEGYGEFCVSDKVVKLLMGGMEVV
ncbi:non-hydrolyzing UDP-N-acetylglucosamine 2-epimerase [Cytobacillus pseudoceanisediminis]|uniref:non-hydrolyzing UDP-N-acetylglucosamine 2-epimerase n=1 Tax=Cytobacillus pseudoceanisediminis TaxID=3051614 RepID=UPI003C2D6265